MKFSRLLWPSSMASALLLAGTPAFAQAGSECPRLPPSTGVTWDTLAGPDYLFCKAIDAAGKQAFAVMLRQTTEFKPRRSLREPGKVEIDGHRVHWYRGEVPGVLVRETLIEFEDDSSAHISIRADSEEALAQVQQIVYHLHFPAHVHED